MSEGMALTDDPALLSPSYEVSFAKRLQDQ